MAQGSEDIPRPGLCECPLPNYSLGQEKAHDSRNWRLSAWENQAVARFSCQPYFVHLVTISSVPSGFQALSVGLGTWVGMTQPGSQGVSFLTTQKLH